MAVNPSGTPCVHPHAGFNFFAVAKAPPAIVETTPILVMVLALTPDYSIHLATPRTGADIRLNGLFLALLGLFSPMKIPDYIALLLKQVGKW